MDSNLPPQYKVERIVVNQANGGKATCWNTFGLELNQLVKRMSVQVGARGSVSYRLHSWKILGTEPDGDQPESKKYEVIAIFEIDR